MKASIPYGYVYEVINLVNGKTYVGQRMLKHDKSWRQYLGSGKAIMAAVEHYGAENFTKRLIAYAWSADELTKIEDAYIVAGWESGKCQYNLGRTPAPDQVRRLPEAVAQERIRKLSEAGKAWAEANPDLTWAARRAAALKEEYEIFAKDKREEVIFLYDSSPSITVVAEKMNVPRRWVRKVLAESNVLRQSRTVPGHNQSEETRKKISDSVKAKNVHLNKKCEVCRVEFRAKRHYRKTCSRKCGHLLGLKTREETNKLR